jgi:hypothetical protein
MVPSTPRNWPKRREAFPSFYHCCCTNNQSSKRLQLPAVHLHQDRVVQEPAVVGTDGLELHVAVRVRHEVVVRRRGLAVDEDAELLGDDRAAAAAGGRGRGGGGEHGGRRGRGGAARVVVGEVDGGDVVDAGAALVLAAGVEADEVLLRVAGHLRRRPARHEVARDVPPVPSPVLLQAHQELPAAGKAARGDQQPWKFHQSKRGSSVCWGCLLVLLLRPGDALLALLVRPALALAAADHVAGALKAQPAGVPVEREPGGLRRAAAAAVAGEGHEARLDAADIALQVVVVGRDVGRRPPGQQRGHPLPPVRRVPVDPRQRALEHLVLLQRPRPGPGPPVRQEPPARRLPREVGRRQHLHPQLRHQRTLQSTSEPTQGFAFPCRSRRTREAASPWSARSGEQGGGGNGPREEVFMQRGAGSSGRIGRCQSGQRW